jgi:hypothetical protein
MSAMFCTLRHLIGWLISAFSSRQDLILENLSLAPTAPWAARQATAASLVGETEIVLGSLEKALARMEAASFNRSPMLAMAITWK